MIQTILWGTLIGELFFIAIWLLTRGRGSPQLYSMQREADLRLTYKRYRQLYPSVKLTYAEYKRMQAQKAYRKAISSMKIKRMVR